MDPVVQIASGQFALLVCGIAYLVWWCIYFYPKRKSSLAKNTVGIVGIAVAVVAGIAAVVFVIRGCGRLPQVQSSVSGSVIVLVGFTAYVLLLLLTKFVFKRPVTTELALLVGWAALECHVQSRLFGAGLSMGSLLTGQLVLIAVIEVLGLVAYTLYYKLPPFKSFVDGCIPLAAVGVSSAAMGALLLL